MCIEAMMHSCSHANDQGTECKGTRWHPLNMTKPTAAKEAGFKTLVRNHGDVDFDNKKINSYRGAGVLAFGKHEDVQ